MGVTPVPFDAMLASSMPDRCVITIGNFDGVHAGHRAILRCARDLREAHGFPVRVLTFDPHPATVLRPGAVPPSLTSRAEKIELLKSVGADQVDVLEPTPALLSLAPQPFLKQMVEGHAPVAVVEGADFRFGKDRAGDIETMRFLATRFGFEVHAVHRVDAALLDQTLVPVSSSIVRWLLAHGRVGDAACCLDRPYELTGRVVAGKQRGRLVGVPTANLDPRAMAGRAVPGDGVYAGLVRLNGPQAYPAAVSVGRQPTFAGHERVVEAHLLGFDGDLYDQTVTICFTRWLRDQRSFPDTSLLRDQLDRDIDQVDRWQECGMIAVVQAAPRGA